MAVAVALVVVAPAAALALALASWGTLLLVEGFINLP